MFYFFVDFVPSVFDGSGLSVFDRVGYDGV